MSIARVDDKQTGLFNFIAGELSKEVNYSQDQSVVSTTEVKNDTLHSKIRELCKKHLRSDLGLKGSCKLRLFEQNTPGFVVTEHLPDRCGENLKSLIPGEENIGGRTAYKYTHPKHEELFFRIYEPASPSDMEIGTGSKSKTKASKLVCMTGMIHSFASIYIHVHSQKG